MENCYLLEDKDYLKKLLIQFDLTRKEIEKWMCMVQDGLQNAASFTYNDPVKNALEEFCQYAGVRLWEQCLAFPYAAIYDRFRTPRESPPQM